MTKTYDTIIVGAGPSGIFCALTLLVNDPTHKIAIFDKGNPVAKRTCVRNKTKDKKCVNCSPCHITTGFGGAGAFSDGKLTYSPNVGGWLTDYISEEKLDEYYKIVDNTWSKGFKDTTLYEFNDEELSYNCQKAGLQLIESKVRHLGTDRTTALIQDMYDILEKAESVDLFMNIAVDSIIHSTMLNKAIGIIHGDKTCYSKNVVLAPGRSGSSWLLDQMNKLNVKVNTNPVDIGIRLETSKVWADALTEKLYDPKIVYYSSAFDDKIRTFCVNPGGEVVTEAYDDVITVNGHSNHNSQTKNTNFALLVSTKFTEPFNEPVEYGKHIARLSNMISGNSVIVQRFGDLIKGRRTTDKRLSKSTIIPTLKAVPGDLSFVLPHRYLIDIIEMINKLDEVAPGIANKDTLLYGVEVKFYSSRPNINNNFEINGIKNLYVAGDGAGITRGLSQASVNGIIVAENILNETKT
jgi:hypothetical protein